MGLPTVSVGMGPMGEAGRRRVSVTPTQHVAAVGHHDQVVGADSDIGEGKEHARCTRPRRRATGLWDALQQCVARAGGAGGTGGQVDGSRPRPSRPFPGVGHGVRAGDHVARGGVAGFGVLTVEASREGRPPVAGRIVIRSPPAVPTMARRSCVPDDVSAAAVIRPVVIWFLTEYCSPVANVPSPLLCQTSTPGDDGYGPPVP